MTMRELFGRTLAELGEKYELLTVLDADVSSSTQTIHFAEKYPERSFNFGIAEANMVAAAAGMATFGLVPMVSSFAFLLTLRAADQIRSLIAYNGLNVKLAGGYCGLSDFADGASHQSVMDLTVMRAMPNMTVLTPSDTETVKWAVEAAVRHNGPVYIRLSRDNAESLHNGNENFSIGKANVIREGEDIVIAVCGTLLSQAVQAAEELAKNNISAAVLEYTSLKPFDRDTLVKYAKKCGKVVAVEEHSVIGGFGSAVSECLGESCPSRITRIGLNDCFGESARSYGELLKIKGFTVENIVEKCRLLIRDQHYTDMYTGSGETYL